MAMVKDNTSSGPKLGAGEKGVHITLLGADLAPGEIVDGQPTPRGLQQAEKHVGSPAPTDVFVLVGQPWHFAGKPGALKAHPKVHEDFPETILHLKVGQEKAVWWSETRFEIKDITLSHNHGPTPAAPAAPTATAPKAAPYPFSAPVVSVPITNSLGKVEFWEARSTVPVQDAKDHTYKISFTIGDSDKKIDPDMFCGG
jgi:hypothetical protein